MNQNRSLPFVSVIIPARNEESYIAPCLDSVLAQDYPKELLEILVIDGLSEDRTREILSRYCAGTPHIRMLSNPGRITPKALNIGIRAARGEIICRMDAHARYPGNYISTCERILRETRADNVGGPITTIPKETGFIADSISRVLSSPFGVGNSVFRTGTASPVWVDTVFGGFYRKATFAKIGLFNENLPSSQDMELNKRLVNSGGRILLHPAITSTYYTRATLKTFYRNNVRNGFWAIFPLKYTSHLPVSIRHFVPLVFIVWLSLSLIVSLFSIWGIALLFAGGIPYLAGAVFFALKASITGKNPLYLLSLPPLFLMLHMCYGAGSFTAVLRLIWKDNEPMNHIFDSLRRKFFPDTWTGLIALLAAAIFALSVFSWIRRSGEIHSYNSALNAKNRDHRVEQLRSAFISSGGRMPGPKALLEVGKTELEYGRMEQAVSIFGQAGKFPPLQEQAAIWRGKALLNLGNTQEALAAALSVINKNLLNAEAYFLAGDVYFLLGNYEQALKHYRDGLKINSKGSAQNGDRPLYRAFVIDGELLLKTGRNAAAITAFSSALSLRPYSQRALLGRSLAYARSGAALRLKALEDIRQYCDRAGLPACNPHDYLGENLPSDMPSPAAASTPIGTGNMAFLFGRYEEALNYYGQATALNPKNKLALYHTAALQNRLGRHDESLATIKKLLAFYPEDNDGLMLKSRALAETGKFKDALLIVRDHFSSEQMSPEVNLWIMKLLYLSQNPSETLNRSQAQGSRHPETDCMVDMAKNYVRDGRTTLLSLKKLEAAINSCLQ